MAVSTAHAQIASDEFGIERFRLSPDESGILDVDSAEIGPHRAITGGLAIGFAHAPLVIYDSSMNAVDPLVERRLTTDLVGAVSLWDRLQVGFGADIIGYQTGTEGLTLDKLPTSGIGDLRIMTKVVLVDGVAFAPTLIVPAGSAGGWLREAGVSFAPEVAVSRARARGRAVRTRTACRACRREARATSSAAARGRAGGRHAPSSAAREGVGHDRDCNRRSDSRGNDHDRQRRRPRRSRRRR
jgi:hypothetical protein